jgi:hypothetical protein
MYVISRVALVYKNEKYIRLKKMDENQRMEYHQAHSKLPMDEIREFALNSIKNKDIEKNSPMWQAFNYMLDRWERLTMFLTTPGAPLDNNLCEQILKRAILHRKASMFYKTPTGAEVGDVYMSLIHTCRLCDVNPFEYLNALQHHAQDVITHAAQWLPWNYREQLAADHARIGAPGLAGERVAETRLPVSVQPAGPAHAGLRPRGRP